MSKQIQDEFIQIRSDKFPKQSGEDEEIVNEGMYGQALSQYFSVELPKLGYSVPTFFSEDWGWWVEIVKGDFHSGICIYCTSEPPELKTYAVCEASKSYLKWKWSKLKKVSWEAEIKELRIDLVGLLENDTEITVVKVSDDPWD